MNEDLICPYCGAIQETYEPDQISADMCWTQMGLKMESI